MLGNYTIIVFLRSHHNDKADIWLSAAETTFAVAASTDRTHTLMHSSSRCSQKPRLCLLPTRRPSDNPDGHCDAEHTAPEWYLSRAPHRPLLQQAADRPMSQTQWSDHHLELDRLRSRWGGLTQSRKENDIGMFRNVRWNTIEGSAVQTQTRGQSWYLLFHWSTLKGYRTLARPHNKRPSHTTRGLNG